MRLFTDGAEFGDSLFFDQFNGVIKTSSPTPPSGTYCYGFGGHDTGRKNLGAQYIELYYRARVYFGSIANTAHHYPSFNKGVTPVVTFDMDGSGHAIAIMNGEYKVTSEEALTSGTWNMYEMHVKIATEEDGGIIHMKRDGVDFMIYNGDTTCDGIYTTIDNISYWADSWLGGATSNFHDDIALNDTSGSEDNSWCGDGKVELLKANAEGDMLEWLCSTGTTHYQLVDDVPSNGDSDYIYLINSSRKKDMFNLTSYTDTNKIVDRIWPESRARDNSISAREIRLGIKTSGNVYLQTQAEALTSSYRRRVGEQYKLNPATSAQWNKTALDALQVVVESRELYSTKPSYVLGG